MNSGINLGWKNKKENQIKRRRNNNINKSVLLLLLLFCKEAIVWQHTYMMWQVCIHDEDEVASGMFHPMDVSGAW